MRLTPAEVHNVAFKKPSIGKRGYDEDEVDAFLDLVEDELARLIEENNELTSRLAAYDAGETPTAAVAPVTVSVVKETATDATPAPTAAPAAAAVSLADSHNHAARLLGLAQETADRLTTEAAAEAESTRSTAHEESERLLAEANAESERLRTEARTFSDELVNEAHTKAEAAESEAKAKAAALQAEAQRQLDETLGSLGAQRAELAKKIDDLRVYEREYRSRLRTWINEQLQQLDGNGETAVTEA